MVRRTLRLRLCFRPSIHRDGEVVRTSTHDQSAFIVADLRYAELRARPQVYRGDRSLFVPYSKHLAGFLVIILYSWVTNSSHCCSHQDEPVDFNLHNPTPRFRPTQFFLKCSPCAPYPVNQLTPTSLNTAARLQKESYSLSDASPSIPFLRFPRYRSYLNGRVAYGAALACGSCLMSQG